MAEHPALDPLFWLIDGRDFAGHVASAYYRTPGEDEINYPAVLLYPLPGGAEGYIDRMDRIGVDVTAHGTTSAAVANALRDSLAGQPHDTPEGFLDHVAVDSLPADVPYPHPDLRVTQMVLRVTTRLP